MVNTLFDERVHEQHLLSAHNLGTYRTEVYVRAFEALSWWKSLPYFGHRRKGRVTKTLLSHGKRLYEGTGGVLAISFVKV